MRRDRRLLMAMVVGALVLGACADDGPAESADPSTPSTTAVAEDATTTTSGPDPEWVTHDTNEDCVCADGSPFEFFSRTNDPQKVVLYFQGGGACFSAETCAFDGGTYDVDVGPEDDPTDAGGIFDFDEPRNPFADWSMVYVPYCTGDVHIGDRSTEYGPDLTVEHNGFVNASHGLDFLVDEFPDATEVFVTGSSAGGVPAPLFGGLAADELPAASVSVLADASGGYPSRPDLNAGIGALWGVYDAAPPWPEIAAPAPEELGIPDLFVVAAEHAPDVRMARFDNVEDSVQRTFSDLAGAGSGGLLGVLDENERLVEDSGIDLPVYLAPGDDHTILGRSALYTLRVGEDSFLDWLTEFVDGGDPGDVRCTACDASTAPG